MCIYFVCSLSHYFSSYWYWDKLFKFPLFINILSNSIKGLRSFSLLLCACACTCAHIHTLTPIQESLYFYILFGVALYILSISLFILLFCLFCWYNHAGVLAPFEWKIHGNSLTFFSFWSLFHFVVVIFCINFIENRDQINWLYTSYEALFIKVNKCIFFVAFPFYFVCLRIFRFSLCKSTNTHNWECCVWITMFQWILFDGNYFRSVDRKKDASSLESFREKLNV